MHLLLKKYLSDDFSLLRFSSVYVCTSGGRGGYSWILKRACGCHRMKKCDGPRNLKLRGMVSRTGALEVHVWIVRDSVPRLLFGHAVRQRLLPVSVNAMPTLYSLHCFARAREPSRKCHPQAATRVVTLARAPGVHTHGQPPWRVNGHILVSRSNLILSSHPSLSSSF